MSTDLGINPKATLGMVQKAKNKNKQKYRLVNTKRFSSTKCITKSNIWLLEARMGKSSPGIIYFLFQFMLLPEHIYRKEEVQHKFLHHLRVGQWRKCVTQKVNAHLENTVTLWKERDLLVLNSCSILFFTSK